MTRELFGTIVIYSVAGAVSVLVLFQMGVELIQWIKKGRVIEKGNQDDN